LKAPRQEQTKEEEEEATIMDEGEVATESKQLDG